MRWFNPADDAPLIRARIQLARPAIEIKPGTGVDRAQKWRAVIRCRGEQAVDQSVLGSTQFQRSKPSVLEKCLRVSAPTYVVS